MKTITSSFIINSKKEPKLKCFRNISANYLRVEIDTVEGYDEAWFISVTYDSMQATEFASIIQSIIIEHMPAKEYIYDDLPF